MSVVYYEGDRIYFRPIELADEPLFRRWINDPRVWTTMGHRLPINGVRQREWIENLGKDDKNIALGIVVREGDRLIGALGLCDISTINHSARYWLSIGDVEFHNQGYGTEATKLMLKYAFEELNLNRVALGVYDHNPRGIRAYQKAGFVYEGRQRQAFYRHGRYRDVLQYAVLRDDWQAGQKGEPARIAADAGSE